MKILFPIFLFLLLFACSDKKTQKPSANFSYDTVFYLSDKTICDNKVSQSGKLISRKQKTYFYMNDALNGDRITDSVITYKYFEYNKDGNVIRELDYNTPKDKTSKPRYEIVRTYKDTLIESEKEFQDGALIRSCIITFDNQNKEIKRIIFRRTPPKDFDIKDIGSLDRYGYDTIESESRYNSLGQLFQVNHYRSSIREKSTSEYSYSNGNPEKQVEKSLNGDTLLIIIYTKRNNQTLQVSDFYRENSIDSSWRDTDRIYKMVNYQKDNKHVIQTVFRYDKFGHEIESTTQKNYR
jgi:hypothetical protein